MLPLCATIVGHIGTVLNAPNTGPGTVFLDETVFPPLFPSRSEQGENPINPAGTVKNMKNIQHRRATSVKNIQHRRATSVKNSRAGTGMKSSRAGTGMKNSMQRRATSVRNSMQRRATSVKNSTAGTGCRVHAQKGRDAEYTHSRETVMHAQQETVMHAQQGLLCAEVHLSVDEREDDAQRCISPSMSGRTFNTVVLSPSMSGRTFNTVSLPPSMSGRTFNTVLLFSVDEREDI